jgi:hypothetical protein
MSTITVSPTLQIHSGGTKFYEIIAFTNPIARRYVEVRRWGPVAQMKSGGGQMKIIEHDSGPAMTDSAARQFNAKQKGDYQIDRSTTFGYIASSKGGTWDSNALKKERHYTGPATREALFTKLALDATADVPIEARPARKPAVEENVDRGEAWGSW